MFYFLPKDCEPSQSGCGFFIVLLCFAFLKVKLCNGEWEPKLITSNTIVLNVLHELPELSWSLRSSQHCLVQVKPVIYFS